MSEKNIARQAINRTGVVDGLTEEELLEVVQSAFDKAKWYWRKGQYGLGVSDSQNAKWEREIQNMKQAYNQLVKIVKERITIDELLTQAGLKIAKDGSLIQQKPTKPKVSREWVNKWVDRLFEQVHYKGGLGDTEIIEMLTEVGLEVGE